MLNYVLIFIVFLVIIFALPKFNALMAGGASGAYDEINKMLFEATGYRHKAIREQPMEEQIAFSNKLTQEQIKTGTMNMELIRSFEGYDIIHHQSQQMVGSSMSLSASWQINLINQPAALFHLAEKNINSFRKELTSGFSRDFQPNYETELTITDPELSKRFAAWGNSQEWLDYFLSQVGIREELLSLKEVDLCVYQNQIIFSDPTQANLRDAMGGTAGMMAAAGNLTKMTKLQITFHEKMAHFLSNSAKILNA